MDDARELGDAERDSDLAVPESDPERDEALDFPDGDRASPSLDLKYWTNHRTSSNNNTIDCKTSSNHNLSYHMYNLRTKFIDVLLYNLN